MRQRLRGREGGVGADADLLLLDVQMPKLDGFEVLDLVGRDVAVVFTTAYDHTRCAPSRCMRSITC